MKVGGYLIITSPDAPTVERDTLQCRHCGGHVELKPGTMGQVYLIPDDRYSGRYREESGAFCGTCYGPICLRCERERICVPLEEQLRRMERRS